METSDDHESLLLDHIEERIGESAQQGSANLPMDNVASEAILLDKGESCLEGTDELES